MPGRIPSQTLEQAPLQDSFRGIESQQADCNRADVRDRLNPRTVNPEMFLPSVAPRMEEPQCLSSVGPERGNIAPFIPIANNAGISQVFLHRRPAVLATEDVVDLVRKAGIILMDEAIFTAMAGPL